MNHPQVEYKNEKLSRINLLERKLSDAEIKARDMLRRLEKALVRCGYTRDYVYRSTARWGAGQRRVILSWKKGNLFLGRGVVKDTRGKTAKAKPQASVNDMTAYELLRVAEHLPFFVDALEDNVRHQTAQVLDAIKKVQTFIEGVEEKPQPVTT